MLGSKFLTSWPFSFLTTTPLSLPLWNKFSVLWKEFSEVGISNFPHSSIHSFLDLIYSFNSIPPLTPSVALNDPGL